MEQVRDQFKTRAQTYSGSANWITDSCLIQAHLDACGRKPPGHVLEMCCGTGVVGRSFTVAGWHVCGVDLTRQMAEEANQYFPCICTPVENIPYLDKSFDVVVLRQAYFLLEDGQKALAEAHRVLKDDGVFVLGQTVPFSTEDSEWLEKIHRFKQAQLKAFYTRETLARELEQAHFHIEHTRELTVQENISHWMKFAPEQSEEKKAAVCNMIAKAPESYRRLHQVQVVNDELIENWNWVIYTARKNP